MNFAKAVKTLEPVATRQCCDFAMSWRRGHQGGDGRPFNGYRLTDTIDSVTHPE